MAQSLSALSHGHDIGLSRVTRSRDGSRGRAPCALSQSLAISRYLQGWASDSHLTHQSASRIISEHQREQTRRTNPRRWCGWYRASEPAWCVAQQRVRGQIANLGDSNSSARDAEANYVCVSLTICPEHDWLIRGIGTPTVKAGMLWTLFLLFFPRPTLDK